MTELSRDKWARRAGSATWFALRLLQQYLRYGVFPTLAWRYLPRDGAFRLTFLVVLFASLIWGKLGEVSEEIGDLKRQIERVGSK